MIAQAIANERLHCKKSTWPSLSSMRGRALREHKDMTIAISSFPSSPVAECQK
jgi:hypothetical protein